MIGSGHDGRLGNLVSMRPCGALGPAMGKRPMRDGGVPEPVRRFLSTHVSSIEQLEVLLLLRSTPDREWSVEEVNRALGSSLSSIQDRLALLADGGLVTHREVEGRRVYRYHPASDATAAVIDELANVYKERRLAVIQLVYARPESDAVHFAKAFKITRTKGDD